MRFTTVITIVLGLGLGLGAGCGGPALRCEAAALPSPTPTYSDTLMGLAVTPTRALMRDASPKERDAFEAMTARLVEACAETAALGAGCAIAALRAELTTLPAPAHPTLFTDIDAALDPSLTAAHDDFAVAARDCEGRRESACDAWLVARAFARTLCDLDEHGGP